MKRVTLDDELKDTTNQQAVKQVSLTQWQIEALQELVEGAIETLESSDSIDSSFERWKNLHRVLSVSQKQ